MGGIALMVAVDAGVEVKQDARTVGETLRKARQEKQLDEAVIAKRLNLHLRQIQQMENNDFGSFQNPVFVKGHLRNYADLLGLNADDVLRLYEVSLSPMPQPKRVQPVLVSQGWTGRRVRFGWGWAVGLGLGFGLALLGGVFLLAWMVTAQSLSQSKAGSGALRRLFHWDKSLAAAPAVITPILTTSVAAAVIPTPAPTPLDMPAGVADVFVADAPSFVPSPESVPASDAPLPPPILSPAPTLRATFKDECWIQVKNAAGEVLDERTHSKGDVLALPADPPLQIWLGRAAAVELTYNDVPVTIPVKPGGLSARFTLAEVPLSGEQGEGVPVNGHE